MTTAFRLRGQMAAGVAIAALVGIGISWFVLGSGRAAERDSLTERSAIVALRAATDVITRAAAADPEGEALRRAAGSTTGRGEALRSIRVVEGTQLVASTAAGDEGAKAAPRRLERDEKPLFDQAQRLRAAVQTNTEEGIARKEEIEIEQLPAGGLRLAVPLERDGAVVGLVQTETGASPPPPAAPLRAAVLYVLGTIALFLVLSLVAGERRAVLAIVAALVVIAALIGYNRHAKTILSDDRQEADASVAADVKTWTGAASEILAAAGVPDATAPDPASWDSDRFRRPLGVVTAAGTIDAANAAASLSELTARLRNVEIAVALLSLALLAFVGLGGARRLISTLVTHRVAYSYTVPAMVGMIVLVFVPFFYGIVLSFTDSTLYNTDQSIPEIWVGAKNYIEILGDFSVAKSTPEGLVWNYTNFYWTFYVTTVWTVSNVTIGVTVGLILALILNRKGIHLRPVYRVLLILPWAMPNYITALIWKGMFHQQFGVVNQMIQIFGGSPIAWFDRPLTSFLTALATNGWLSFPFMMVVSLGALQSIPAELYEAARVDGATRLQQFRAITLPSLKPALIPAIILSVVWTFNQFNVIYLVTAGEPGSSTEILITQSYKFAFEKYRYGYAAAYSTVIFLILLAYGWFQNRATRATESNA